MAEELTRWAPGSKEPVDDSDHSGPWEPDPEKARTREELAGMGFPTVEAPETGKNEAKVDPPLPCHLVRPDGSFMEAEIIGVECDSGELGGDQGFAYATKAPGQQRYLVRRVGVPKVKGRRPATMTLTAEHLRLKEAPRIEDATPATPAWPEGTTGPSTPGPDATQTAQRLAKEHGIDLATVKGTGTGGRITVNDIRALMSVPVDEA